jgi:ligand-binding SRPBCC domain-containing protein
MSGACSFQKISHFDEPAESLGEWHFRSGAIHRLIPPWESIRVLREASPLVDGARAEFGIPEQVRPLMVIAVGTLADYATVAPEIAERDHKPRSRRPLDEVAFSGTWERPWNG